MQILQLDVLHDLALLRAGDATGAAGGAGKTFDALPFRAASDAARAGRADLLARQSARRRLHDHAGHVQRPRQAQLLSADLLRRRALGRHERRPGARRGRPRRRRQRRAPRRRRAGELPRAGRVRDRAARARQGRGADRRPGLRDRRRAAAEAPGRAHRPLHPAGLEGRRPIRAITCRCRPTSSCAAGARARSRAPAASTSSAPTA